MRQKDITGVLSPNKEQDILFGPTSTTINLEVAKRDNFGVQGTIIKIDHQKILAGNSGLGGI